MIGYRFPDGHTVKTVYCHADGSWDYNIPHCDGLLSPVYTIQPVVKPVVNRVNVCIHDTTGCQPRCQSGCTTRFDNRLNEQLLVQHGCQIGLTTGWMFVYTIQPVVKPVVQPL